MSTGIAPGPKTISSGRRPCDACRRRKARCIIPQDKEVCMMCQSRGEECTFVQSPQRRKRRRIEGNERGSVRSPDAERSISSKPPIDDYDALPNSLLQQTLGLQNRQHSHYLGHTTSYSPHLPNLLHPSTLRRLSSKTHFLIVPEPAPDVASELANLDRVEALIAPHGPALVRLYFRIIHPAFPIMDKGVFLEKYARTYREFTPSFLAAVYILALNWWNYSPELANLKKPDKAALEALVAGLMSDVLNRPKLSTVQAGLLLLQRPEGESWALTGQLIAIGQNLGLHLECESWKIPGWERALRKRLAWALWMQDCWGALIHGRPMLIGVDDWAVKALEARDFPDEVEEEEEEGSEDIEGGRAIFACMISLTEILADILRTFFSGKAMKDLEAEGERALLITLERAKPLQLRLKEWHATLPHNLGISQTKARRLSSTGSLHLAYFAAEITLHRAIIRFDALSPDPSLRAITRAAARTRFTSALDLVASLQPAHLQSFWYFASKTNLAIIATFGSLLWASSASSEEREFYRAQLAGYRWGLRVSSKAAEFMGFTVGILDGSVVFAKGEAGAKKDGEGVGSGGAEEVSPSVGTEEELMYAAGGMESVGSDFDLGTLAPDIRPSWMGFDGFAEGEWTLDGLYDLGVMEVGEGREVGEFNGGTEFVGF